MVEMASGRATPEREAMLALVEMWGRFLGENMREPTGLA